MAQYRDLNAPPQQTFAEIVAAMQDQAKSSKTGAAGVKDLGESGDVVWPRPDGAAVSVRDVDLDLADARQRIEDAEGDLAGAQARIDTALDAEGHVREDEILRNATLLGETVVQEINVTDKLVGTDGVFTGTVDFANVNVTGELLANEISGEHIYGTVLEGGEVRAGGGTTGDIVVLGDDTFHPSDGTAPRPGLMVAEGGKTYTRVPGVGVSANGGVEVSGGATPEGGNAYMYTSPFGVFAYSNPGSNSRTGYSTRLGVGMDGAELLAQKSGEATVSIRASAPLVTGGQTLLPPRAIIQVQDPSGTSNIDVRADRAQLRSGSREILVDASGVWVKTGSKAVNLEGTTWASLPLINSWSAYLGGGGYYKGLRAQRTPLGIRLDGMVKGGAPGSVIAVLPDDMQDVAAKIFTAPAAGDVSAFLEVSTSPVHGGKYCLKYRSGPSAPAFVSVSTDAALL